MGDGEVIFDGGLEGHRAQGNTASSDQKAAGRGQKTEDRGQRTEIRGQQCSALIELLVIWLRRH
jgi:hypothetical protein